MSELISKRATDHIIQMCTLWQSPHPISLVHTRVVCVPKFRFERVLSSSNHDGRPLPHNENRMTSIVLHFEA